MIKCYCDECGKEIPEDEAKDVVYYRHSGYKISIRVFREQSRKDATSLEPADLCKVCLAGTIRGALEEEIDKN